MNIPFIEDENLLAIIPMCWIIGKILKTTPHIKNWVIPWILLSIAVAVVFVWKGVLLYSFIQAIILCGLSVYGNQLVKQWKEMVTEFQASSSSDQ